VINPSAPLDFPLERHNFFTIDAGGVLEFYPSKRAVVRFEGSDLVLRHQDPSGHMFQGQFGGKVGKRFEKWGLFGKARPGFVAYTQVSELIGTHVEQFGPFSFVVPEFRTVAQYYPSLDIG